MGVRVPDRLAPLPLPDLTGRRAVITGASSGLGAAAARALAEAGAEVILAVRNRGKAQIVVESIRQQVPGARLQIEDIELGSLDSIEAFANQVSEDIDVLINNAGLNSTDRTAVTTDGFDLCVGVNYLGAYALTARLWPRLHNAGGRVVMLGSLMARFGRITPSLGQPGGRPVQSYSDSKLAAVVFAQQLRRRCAEAGSPVSVSAAHPGWALTDIFGAMNPPAWMNQLSSTIGWVQSAADGVQPVLLAATQTDPAAYYGPSRKAGLTGPPAAIELPARAQSAPGALLWELSATLTDCEIRP